MQNNNLPAPTPESNLPVTRFSFADEDQYGEEKTGPGLKRYIRAVLRYKWLVLLLAVAGTVAGLYAGRFVSLTYTARGTLWLQTVDRETENQGPIRSAQLLRDNAWIELLRSVPVLEPVVREQRLYVKYEPEDRDVMESLRVDSIVRSGVYRLRVSAQGQTVELRTQDDVVVDRASVGESLGRNAGLAWTPPADALRPGREVRFTVATPTSAAIRLAGELSIAMPQRSNFLSVAYVDRDAERAAAVVNSITDSYVDVATGLKRVHLVETRKILNEQLTYARANLEAAEFELNDFLVRTATLPTQPATPVNPGTQETRREAMNSYFSLRVERDQLQRDRAAIQRVLDDGSPTLSIDGLNVVASVQQSPELNLVLEELTEKRAEVRALLERFTADHPQVIRARREVSTLEKDVIPQLARNLLAELNNQLRVLDGMVDSSAGELQEIPPRLIAEAGYRRAVASAETLHNNLLERFENARLAAETTQPDVTVLTPASVPQQPDSDVRLRILLLGVAGGFGLGLGLAILLELLDRRVRYAEQVSDGMHLAILGAIPDLTARRRLFAAAREKGEMVEALRGIRLNLTHAYGSAGPVMATITSPGPGDGKTFLTSNLGTTFAELGMRTLIIDADTRRGTMHHVMKLRRKPGLTDYLSRSAGLAEVIQPTPVKNLDMLPSGTRLPHAPDLLSSPYMGDLLAYIRTRYDAVLIDSPPLGAGVDPLVLATATGNVMLIMRTGKTDRMLAEAKLAILDRLPVRVLGAVLNGIDGDTAYKYYSYLPGYEAGQEDTDDASRLLQPV